MNRWINAALTMAAVAAVAHAAGAQGMAKPMAAEKHYTGCVEAATMGSGFTLTHVAADMGTGAMGKDGMGKDSMGKDGMKKDAMGKDAMAHDAMAPTMLSISSTAVDLSKHVGHKVSVTAAPAMADGMAKHDAMGKMDGMAKKDTMGKADGMSKDMPAMTVLAVTMIAATCTP